MSRPLGISVQALVRWSERGRMAARIVPVAIVDAPPAGTVTLVAAAGLRIEGVAVVDAIAILQALG
jgi:hypothetical protein